MPNPTPTKPIAPDAMRAASDPMGAASQAWAAGVDPAAKAAMQALRTSQAVAKRAKQEAALPTMEEEGSAGEEEQQNQPTIRRDIEWSPVSRAIGVLLGAGHGLTPGAAGGFGNSFVAGKAQAEADRRERLGEPKTAAETASKWGMNTLTDLWDISTMAPGLAAQVLLPQEAPPGSENETNLERSLRGFGEGAQIGKGVAQGLVGGTADVLEHPLESLAERPWTTMATYLPGIRALKNAGKAAHASMAGAESVHPVDVETQPGKTGPEAPRTPQLDVRGADVFDRAVSKIKDSFRSVGGKWADQYLAKIANGFHAGDPVVTAFVEDLARGEERADARLKATAEKLAGAVGRDTAKPRAPVRKGKPMPGLPVEQQVVVPGEEHLQTEHDLARGLIPPEERVVGQEIGGGRKNPLTYSREVEDVNPLGDVPALQPESHAAIEAQVNELMDAANMTDAERRQYKPAIVHDVMMHAADIVGHDGETGNWRGQMHGNPEQFAKDFIASAEEHLGRTLDNKERAGILEAIDPRSKDVTEAPRTGLESGAAQEFVHAQEVAPNPEGGVGRAFEPDELTVSEADARKARQKAMDTAERDAMRLRAAAAAHEEHALTAEHEHLRAKAAAAEANYHAVGAADELSNRRSEAQQSKWAAETARKLARDKAQKAIAAQADADKATARANAAETSGASPEQIRKARAEAEAKATVAATLADEAGELLADSQRAAKVAKVRATEAATAEQRHENVRQDHIAAKKAEGVAKTIYDRASAKHDQAREAHLAAQAEADKAQAETHKFDARRLVRTSVVPHIDGVPLDPAKLVPPRVLTPAERAKAFQSSFKNMAERYKGRQEMGRQLEAHANQFETIPDDEVPKNFRHTVQVATFDKPASQLVRGAESKTAAQNTLAKLAYGIVRGIQRGDMRPVVLPQGVRSSFLRGLIESATHDLPEAERAKVQAVARQIGGYLPMDPDTGYGTKASPVWADPLVADAMKWHARANKPGEGVLHEITQALKGNVTGKSLAGGVNNALPNLNGTAIRRGLGPVEFITKAETLMRNLKQWGETGKVESGPVGKAAQKFGAVADDAMQARAFDALAKAGNLSLDFVSKELGERQLSPAEKLRMNKALAWYKDPQTDLPTTKFSKWFYQHGDHILRVEEGVMQFEQKARSIDELKTGQYQDLNVSRNRTVRIGKEGERYTAQDPFAEKAEDRKPRYVSKEKVDELIGQDATYHAAAITQDYGDLSQAAKAVKSLHNKGLEIVTPFVSWADKAKDVPFGAGLLSKTLFQSPYEMSTNNPAALARAARAEAGLALRRAVWVNGVRQQLTQQGSNGPLADAYRHSSEDDQSVIIGNLTHPNVVEGVPLGQAAQFGPTGNLVGGMASLATLAQRLHEESGAKAGTQSEFSKAVQDAVSGKDFSVKKAMRLAYLSGGPLLRIYDALNGNGDAGDVVRSLSNSAIGGTNAGILRAIAGASSDKGREPHPRLPEGATSDFLAKASGRNRSLGITPEGSQALIPWMVQQIVGLGWQAKDFDPRDPKAVFQYTKMVKQALKKGMDVPADKDIGDLPADKADEMTGINDVIDDTIDRINDNYERVYELLSNKGKTPQK